MAGFSGSEAFSSGFRLIGREPLSVVAWGGAYLVLAVLPQLLMFGTVWPDLMHLMRMAEAGGEPSMSDLMAFGAKAPLLQLISIAASVVSTSVLLGAVYRSMLTPEDRRFFYLRLSGRELAIGLSMIVLYILFVILLLGVGIVCGIAAFVLHSLHADWAIYLLVLAAAVGVLWICLRFSLALVMAFDQSRFIVFEAWEITKGQTLKIFLVILGLILIVLVAEVVVGGVIFGIMGLSVAGMMMGGMDDPFAVVAAAWPWVAVAVVVGPIIVAAVYAVLTAPFADIYAQLTRAAPDAAG